MIRLFFYVVCLFCMPTIMAAQNDKEKVSSTARHWCFIFDPGVTNINFALYSQSGVYQLDGQPTGINSHFNFYDSRGNYFPPSVGPFTDQANHYLLTLKNTVTNWVFTLGVLHDKREETPGGPGRTFRYTKGGFNTTFQLGKQWIKPLGNKDKSKAAVECRVGGYASFNNINVHLEDLNRTFVSVNDGRKFSGGGLVVTTQATYFYHLKKQWGLSLSLNGTLMAGKAFTDVVLDQMTGKLSVGYLSFSAGPSVNITFGY